MLLGAAALPEPPPPPPACSNLDKAKAKFSKLDSLNHQKFTARGNLLLAPGTPATFDPLNRPTLIALAGSTNQTAYLVPTGAPGSSICGRLDGWTVSGGRTFTYTNRSGFVYVAGPPAYCLGGTGLKQVKFTDDRARRGRIKFSLTVDDTYILRSPGNAPAALEVQLGWDGHVGEACAATLLNCVASQGRAVCK